MALSLNPDICTHRPLALPTETVCSTCWMVLDGSPLYRGPSNPAMLGEVLAESVAPGARMPGTLSQGARDSSGGRVRPSVLRTIARSHSLNVKTNPILRQEDWTRRLRPMVTKAIEQATVPRRLAFEARDMSLRIGRDWHKGALKGHRLESLFAVVLLHVLRRHRVLRDWDTVVALYEVPHRTAYHLFLELGREYFPKTMDQRPSTAEWVQYIADGIPTKLPKAAIGEAKGLGNAVDARADLKRFSSSKAAAGALLYLCWCRSGTGPSLKDMAKWSYVCDLTLRKHALLLSEALGIEHAWRRSPYDGCTPSVE